ncbi:hypothetical protein [Flavobacterium degerlachei]|jgi:poly-beta-hydroxyalkanoate depolymerase|uniref:Uncharacterized protein n=1 Tax=Flavobacterium degerlachei TaxID=229203 RepID=A0A1H3GSW1_9FLAO|nr:hypothetical protein [Flavobacterium degerlachei]SDY05419.1 hypothetical protein SAMN05444338_1266 [Flavobacterium degerlachei]
METKLFYNAYEINALREIRRASKNKYNTDLNKLKENLAKKNIHVDFEVKNGTLRNISFKKNEFEINSIKGNDRVFTDRIVKSVNNNKNSLEQSKKAEKTKEYNRFEELKKHREERTQLLNRDMYNTKGFSK